LRETVHVAPERDFPRGGRDTVFLRGRISLRNSRKMMLAEGAMAIYRLLKGSPLEPELIRSLEAAYEKTLRAIGLVDRDDPITEMTRKIIEIAQTGIQDPAKLSAMAIKEIGIP
jgi:hypothetical protein